MTSQVATERAALARKSGAYAMLAVDQREGLRAMLAQHQPGPIPDSALTAFKLAAIRVLSPHASAVLIDRELAWQQSLDAGVVAPGCALIAAADVLISGPDELVADVAIDDLVVPEQVRDQGAVALKLLVVWRPGDPAEPRIAMVDDFIARCRRAGLVSIIEPVTRRPRGKGAWDREAAILQAAVELGCRGAGIYKGEVPYFGTGSEAETRRAYAAIDRTVDGDWVVLSSGVPQDAFPRAVEWACREGASGFLAGRAIWAGTIGAPDVSRALQEDAVPRLQRLCDVVDRVLGG
jgi:sulfofructosephosphate aldolase